LCVLEKKNLFIKFCQEFQKTVRESNGNVTEIVFQNPKMAYLKGMRNCVSCGHGQGQYQGTENGTGQEYNSRRNVLNKNLYHLFNSGMIV